jgi:hypothetical protein
LPLLHLLWKGGRTTATAQGARKVLKQAGPNPGHLAPGSRQSKQARRAPGGVSGWGVERVVGVGER